MVGDAGYGHSDSPESRADWVYPNAAGVAIHRALRAMPSVLALRNIPIRQRGLDHRGTNNCTVTGKMAILQLQIDASELSLNRRESYGL